MDYQEHNYEGACHSFSHEPYKMQPEEKVWFLRSVEIIATNRYEWWKIFKDPYS